MPITSQNDGATWHWSEGRGKKATGSGTMPTGKLSWQNVLQRVLCGPADAVPSRAGSCKGVLVLLLSEGWEDEEQVCGGRIGLQRGLRRCKYASQIRHGSTYLSQSASSRSFKSFSKSSLMF